MVNPGEKAVAYLQELEADRLAAIAVSEEKAEEAKLIEARQEGFRRAMEILGVEAFPILTRSGHNKPRRRKRNISELILNELSFSGRAMTTKEIVRAINYRLDLTERSLNDLDSFDKITREEDGRWAILNTTPTQHEIDGSALTNEKSSIKNGPAAR